MGRSTDKETRLSEQRKYRSWTAQQKIEIVLAGLRGDHSVKDVCREHAISDTLYYSWRDELLEGGREALAGKEERSGERELRPAGARVGAGAGAQDVRAGDRRGSIAGLGVSVRVARSRELVARGFAVAAVARVMQISRQALYWVPTPRAVPQRRPVELPRQLWQLDLASVWVAEHGWC
jgi:transposase-like protein